MCSVHADQFQLKFEVNNFLSYSHRANTLPRNLFTAHQLDEVFSKNGYKLNQIKKKIFC